MKNSSKINELILSFKNERHNVFTEEIIRLL